MVLYLKGYKVDPEKKRARFSRRPEDLEEDYEFSYYEPIVDNIPVTAYKYIGCGMVSDDELIIVFVLEDGYDRAALDVIIVTSGALPKGSLIVLTTRRLAVAMRMWNDIERYMSSVI